MTLSGSTLYGTTEVTIFSIPASGGTPTTLFSFDGTHGENPFGSLTLSGSTLYGTTQDGGANGDGTIFSIPVTGGTPTVLYSFDGTRGSVPNGDLTLSGSTLYGMTDIGGANGDGTIFAYTLPEPGDANLDGTVDINDLTIVLSNYGDTGTSWSQGDFTGDGTVDINDLSIVLSNFGTTNGAGIKAVPEPSTFILLAIASVAIFVSRRRK